MMKTTTIVDAHAEELTLGQVGDIRDMLKAGFSVLRIAQFFRVSVSDLQRRLDNSIRQRLLFEDEVSL